MGAPAGETYLQLQSGQYLKPSAVPTLFPLIFQVLLVYCCLQSLLGFLSDCLTGQDEALQYEEEDWEAEVPVTARAAHLASLLPGIAAAVLGTLLAFNCGAALSKAKDERIVADPASIVETIYH